MKTIFIVDDNDLNLLETKTALQGSYRIFTMQSAAKMFSLLEKIKPDLILLDIEMPEMDGFSALKILRKDITKQNIPVMFLTATIDDEIEARGFELGAIDFVTKPFAKRVLLNRIDTHLNINELVIMRTKRIEKLQDGIVSVLADVVENRDHVTGEHTERTTKYIGLLIRKMVTMDEYKENVRACDCDLAISSSRLHDVGKIAVSDLILNKPAKLTDEEFEEMKKHALAGEKIIEKMIEKTGETEFLDYAKILAGYHHEKWDGTGYPHRLKGEEIPLLGRVMAIADVYDALASERPYKKAFSHEDAVKIIVDSSGKQFDPKIVKIFVEIEPKFKEISKTK